MQYDNIYEIKKNKKDNNLKNTKFNQLIQSRVPNNTKIHQPIVDMQEKKFKKGRRKKFAREKERNNILCVGKLYIKWEREL